MSNLWAPSPGKNGTIGISFIYTKNHPAESCGTNGLPLTPNTTKILGVFKDLQNVQHDNLCVYIDAVKSKHDKIIILQEHYNNTVWKISKEDINRSIKKVAYSILNGLDCLHKSGYHHNHLSVDNVLITEDDQVKLSQYGLFTLTEFGELVSFPVSNPCYMAPEIILQGCRGRRPRSWSSHSEEGLSEKKFLLSDDIWSFGILLLELLSKKRLWKRPNISLEYMLKFVIRLMRSKERSAARHYAIELEFEESFKMLPLELSKLIESCLIINPEERPTTCELLQLPLFEAQVERAPPRRKFFISTDFRAKNLSLSQKNIKRVHPVRKRNFFELYHLWRLAGGDPESELRKKGLTKSKPSICTLPRLCIVEGQSFGSERDDYKLFDRSVVSVSFDSLIKRLENIPEEAYYPLLVESRLGPDKNYVGNAQSLPFGIREVDIEYQLHRIILFERLLKSYPYTRDRIIEEAMKDVPPLYRGETWAAILGVIGDVQRQYENIDKDTPTSTDRQIEVDIPRCHQYIDLLASPVAHAKFKRILKAWIVSHPEYVYWQGLDSLCAPFLLLNFNDEALAYASLSAFIPKYLNGFFLKDNSNVMQEYLTKFSQLLAFHDPLLSVHLAEVRFVPELYAIPWFLTMFAHVFPLNKIFHLWDTLLLGSASFPLFVGLAILRQLRELLMSSGFNECISYFSNMPEIDMERCLKDSKEMWETTPKSATYRKYEAKKESISVFDANGLSPRTPIANEQEDMAVISVPLNELKAEKCLRISAEDLLIHLSKNEVLPLDIRQPQDYSRGSLSESINLPFSNCFDKSTEEITKIPTEVRATKKIVVVISGGRGHMAACLVASALLKAGVARVCTLHKGIDSLRNSNALVLPS
ncbi:TBC domain-containing protein kinase-like protein [Artemia franciscana]|uniref:TBC domain-containing protein kinase-like protein n=1 Tax=Artemia franciscana TaxID=6661 RepID=A0AA88LC50_ARTSF|nr:hypothetical protein QYM36_004556 [Artemia franciscana]KAK2720704.1 hypothetical protein QYM36_004556 [Artemia franciscana]KAK2720705.1 hypothetical protein QYM36_004556 [Artemia franciscana]